MKKKEKDNQYNLKKAMAITIGLTLMQKRGWYALYDTELKTALMVWNFLYIKESLKQHMSPYDYYSMSQKLGKIKVGTVFLKRVYAS